MEADRIVAPQARPWDANKPVYVCTEPLRPFGDWWPTLKLYGNKIQPVQHRSAPDQPKEAK